MNIDSELIVDNFAGGGGASTGIEMALNRPVDIAINHDRFAVALHQANHPGTRHFCEDVFKIKPFEATRGKPVGLAWFSPDCKHFSKAKGGKPKSKKIRGLAWIVVKWAAHPTAAPRVIILENVEEFEDWGPLLPDGTPCPKRKGRTFNNFIRRLQQLGYAVEWRQLRACDYGAPTIRNRLFLIARRDGRPIVWPAPTHGNPKTPGFAESGLKPWKIAADCIDWTVPCHSIFLNKRQARKVGVKRPLARATMARLARGVFKFVINAKEPFIAHRGEKGLCVPLVQQSGHMSSNSCMVKPAGEPLRTQATAKSQTLVEVFLARYNGSHKGKKDGANRNHPVNEPIRTQDSSNRFGVAAVHLAKHYTGVTGSALDTPIGSITSIDHHSLVATHLSKLYGTTTGSASDEPLHSITGGGQHIAQVEAFLTKYYGSSEHGCKINDPMHVITAKARFGLVTILSELYQIIDICIRMLTPRELYRGQGFPDSYVIDITMEVQERGKTRVKPLTQEQQVRMCGNSVCPPIARAIVAANVPELARHDTKPRFTMETTRAGLFAVPQNLSAAMVADKYA